MKLLIVDDHATNLKLLRLQLEAAVDLAKRLGIPPVATSDAHPLPYND